MFKYFYEIVSIIAGIIILLLNFLIVSDIAPFIVPILNVVGGLIAVTPPTLLFLNRYKTTKEIEQQFIFFIRDLTDSINSGMTLPMALKHCSKKNYGKLNQSINYLASQVDWGIPFKRALQTFGKKTNSVPIKRAITTIIQTYEVGGKISDTLSAVGRSLIEIDKIKKERSASVHAQIITSYMIFFVFIFILIILNTVLIPALVSPETPEIYATTEETMPITQEIYTESFINFVLIQGFFAGLATGKMAEGSIASGIKHSLLLMVIGYTLFSFSSQFQLSIF